MAMHELRHLSKRTARERAMPGRIRNFVVLTAFVAAAISATAANAQKEI